MSNIHMNPKPIKKVFASVGAICLSWCVAHTASATLLIGTEAGSANESISAMNALIADYNTDFGTSLPSIADDGFIDKLEGQDSGEFINGVLELSYFNFFNQDDVGTKSESIFDSTVNFDATPIDFTVDGFDDLDSPVMGFEIVEPLSSLQYYVSKNGNAGWSLWYWMEGFNPVYADDVTDGATRGAITDDSLAYDPASNAVSHISFYGSYSVPEPGSIALFGSGLGLLGLYQRRRRDRAARA